MSPFFNQDNRERALDILSFIYETWASSWQETLVKLGTLNLPQAALQRLNFHDNEQRRAIVSHLAKLLVAWEAANEPDFSSAVAALARELRPSLAAAELEEGSILTQTQLAELRAYLSRLSTNLKSSIAELKSLPAPSFNPGVITSVKTLPLTNAAAETLLRERLGLSFFDFLEFNSEPTFGNGYFPALLQDSIDQGL